MSQSKKGKEEKWEDVQMDGQFFYECVSSWDDRLIACEGKGGRMGRWVYR